MQKHFKRILLGLSGSLAFVVILLILAITTEKRPYWVKYVAMETIVVDRADYGMREKRQTDIANNVVNALNSKNQTTQNEQASTTKIIRETNLGQPVPRNDSDWPYQIPRILHQKWLTPYVPRMTIPWISSWNEVSLIYS